MADKPQLSQPQAAILVILMAQAREMSNPELKQHYGLTLDGKDRRRLNDLKYVDSHKVGRSFVHVLADQGWKRASDGLAEEVGRPHGSAASALRAVLENLPRFLHRADLALADVFGHDAVADVFGHDDLSAKAPAGAGGAAGGSADIEARIRGLYHDLTVGPGGWVSITDLRALLDGVERAETDAALRALSRQPDVTIVPESNQKALSRADRLAAVRIGDQDKHLLAIGV